MVWKLVCRQVLVGLYREALNHGVYFMSGWHHGYSWVHTEKDIDDSLEGIENSLRSIQKR